MKTWLSLVILAILPGMASCAPEISKATIPHPSSDSTPPPRITSEMTPIANQMETTPQITSIEFDKSFYRPGEPIRLSVHLRNEIEKQTNGRLITILTHLAETIDRSSQTFTLIQGEQTVNLNIPSPGDGPRGYGLDVHLENEAGELMASAWGAFDILDHWTQSPRYGFLSDFPPGRADAEDTITTLNHYHLNGLQFYDWMYRHEQLLTDQEPYIDLLGRRLSRETVTSLISAAHQRGMAAMAYTAVYGASLAFYREHPDWALRTAGGEPVLFGQDFMAIMDPRPGSPWSEHLLGQFNQVLEQTDFDGIHLDQYGDPKIGFDAQGNEYDLARPLAEFIDATKALVQARRQEGAVIFNAVTNWPIEAVAPASQDLVYIEVWPPYKWFDDLHRLIVEAQRLGDGKPVVLAAYLDPANIHNVLLTDAVIFSSGGGHIEIGEGHNILADPYFPAYKPIRPDLATKLLRYYDFTVRYQDVIGPRTKDATQEFNGRIRLVSMETGELINTAANAVRNKVWPILRQGEGFTAISLVNLLGLDSPDWNEPIESAPVTINAARIRIDNVDQVATQVWLASPDGDDLSARQLDFRQENSTLDVEIPSLIYWDLIVIEWKDQNLHG